MQLLPTKCSLIIGQKKKVKLVIKKECIMLKNLNRAWTGQQNTPVSMILVILFGVSYINWP